MSIKSTMIQKSSKRFHEKMMHFFVAFSGVPEYFLGGFDLGVVNIQ